MNHKHQKHQKNQKKHLSKLQKEELNKLIDKYENRKDYGKNEKSFRRTFLHISEKSHPDYYHVSDSTFRLEYNASAEELEKLGFVELEWEKFQKGEFLKKIALNEKNLDEIYEALERKPKIDYYKELEEVYNEYKTKACQAGAPDELAKFYDEMLKKLSELKKLPHQIRCQSIQETRNFLSGLNRLVLKSLEKNPVEIPKRQFSIELYGDSKKWERFEKKILYVLQNYFGNPGDSGDTGDSGNEDISLAEFGIVENPRPVNVRGRLEFETKKGRVDLNKFYPEVGLSPRMIQDMMITSLNAKVVVTIENLTSYYLYIAKAPEDHLVIFLGGYHNKMRRNILTRILEYQKTNNLNYPKFYHWGDIDLGGFQIFNHLKEKTGINFKPLMMDKDTYKKHITKGHKFDSKYSKKLKRLLEETKYSQFHPVIELMLKNNIRIEQEAITDIAFPEFIEENV